VGGGGAAINAATAAVNPALTSGTQLANTLNAAQIPATTISPGLTGLGGMQNVGLTQGAGIASTVPQVATPAVQASQSMYPALSDAQAKTFFESDMGLGNAYKAGTAQAAQPGMLQRAGNWYGGLSPMGKIGVGIGGGVALNALSGGFNQPTIEAKEEEENPFGLATYDRKKFKPYIASSNVYRPTYAAQGGIMEAYAAGGVGGNSGYPMSQMDMTQYSVPSQMPTSAQVVNADYEQRTDPYLGSPIGMAEGGVARTPTNGFYAKGGQTNAGSPVYYDSQVGKYYTMGYPDNLPGGILGIFGRSASKQYIGDSPSTAASNLDKFVPTEQVVPNVYESGYQDYIEGTPMVTSPEAFPSSPNFIDAYNLLAATSPNIASTISPEALVAATGVPSTSGTTGTAGGMASGGIAGYNLGGYASGGNPRLLKGPGDGMSDNIPATIGGRQPARLADGEFVVPADVVSHLGNGSTDAGAKHLYNMMDRVRKARTGNKKQGKQIKPGKFLPK
jgi:hypothetical protein